MSTSLYIEALNAAEELKFATEEKVKQNLIEAMTPQIKLMVEQNIMSETQESVFYETVDGLVALGYSKQEATTCVKTIFSVEETTATLLKKALQLMQR